MGEKNIRRMFETIARIISEREKVKITVTKVEKKNDQKENENDMHYQF